MSRADAVLGRGWRLAADTRRLIRRDGSATPALQALGRPRRSVTRAWNRSTSAGVAEYRAAIEPAGTQATVVCVSQRPGMLGDVIANVARQVDIDVHFVFVANHAGFDDDDVHQQVSELTSVTVLHRSAELTLGECLNAGFDAAPHRFVAKFDDDDWYGRHYLADALRAHSFAGAGVVGKHTYYADVGSPPRRYLRFPTHEFSYSATLAGGTLVVDRDRVGDLEFDHISIGEDRRYLRACHRRGVSTFAADRFGFVQRRTGDNTWSVSDEQFLIGCEAVDTSDPEHEVDQ